MFNLLLLFYFIREYTKQNDKGSIYLESYIKSPFQLFYASYPLLHHHVSNSITCSKLPSRNTKEVKILLSKNPNNNTFYTRHFTANTTKCYPFPFIRFFPSIFCDSLSSSVSYLVSSDFKCSSHVMTMTLLSFSFVLEYVHICTRI